jgi:ornithine cyclodeaminase/alanine dehydrogenase-like protein (mu-crystallin family)
MPLRPWFSWIIHSFVFLLYSIAGAAATIKFCDPEILRREREQALLVEKSKQEEKERKQLEQKLAKEAKERKQLEQQLAKEAKEAKKKESKDKKVKHMNI